MKKQLKIEKLERKIKKLNKLYRDGSSAVSDKEYDSLIEELRSIDPTNGLLNRGIIEESTDDMVPLPIRMGSLNKVKSIKELKSWVKKINAESFVITPKYDGISLLLDLKNHKAYTRGDGLNGQLRPHHVETILGPKWWDFRFSEAVNCKFNLVWGEAIMNNRVELPKGYKNPRNAVAGLFNSPDGYKQELCKDIYFVAYGCTTDTSINKARKLEDLHKANEFDDYHFKVATHEILTKDEILGMSKQGLFNFLKGVKENNTSMLTNFLFATDGVVIEVNSPKICEKLGRLPNGNPAYAIAYKDPAWDAINRTTVLDILYSVTKGGKIAPVIIINPVEVDGVTIERVTGYNMKYILENHICPGAEIGVIRSGGVIPKHVKTFSYNELSCKQYFDSILNDGVCPSCGKKIHWNESKVDMVCDNPKCDGLYIAHIVSFFEKLGCEGFSEPTITKLLNAGFDLESILKHIEGGGDFSKIIGPAKSKQMIEQIMAHRYPSLSVYLDALNISYGVIGAKTYQAVFDHLGSKKAVKLILSTGILPYRENLKSHLEHELSNMAGIGESKLTYLVEAIHTYRKCLRYNYGWQWYPLIRARIKITRKPKEINGTVCFTGFRDKELAEKLTKKGYIVTDNFTKDCTLLVAKDPNSGSSKIQKAVERGVQVLSIQELLENINKQ